MNLEELITASRSYAEMAFEHLVAFGPMHAESKEAQIVALQIRFVFPQFDHGLWKAVHDMWLLAGTMSNPDSLYTPELTPGQRKNADWLMEGAEKSFMEARAKILDVRDRITPLQIEFLESALFKVKFDEE